MASWSVVHPSRRSSQQAHHYGLPRSSRNRWYVRSHRFSNRCTICRNVSKDTINLSLLLSSQAWQCRNLVLQALNKHLQTSNQRGLFRNLIHNLTKRSHLLYSLLSQGLLQGYDLIKSAQDLRLKSV